SISSAGSVLSSREPFSKPDWKPASCWRRSRFFISRNGSAVVKPILSMPASRANARSSRCSVTVSIGTAPFCYGTIYEKSQKYQVMSMKITADQMLFETVPDLKFGILHYNRINTSDAPGMLKGRIGYFYQEMQIDLEDKNVTDIPGVAEWRKVWKAFGKDPGRY